MQADHSSRMPFIDALKAMCCLLIVTHHLAIYGPMSDIAYPLIPALLDWLREYGRIAVQMFFVIAGFLAAAKLAPQGLSLVTTPIRLIQHRYSEINHTVSGRFNVSDWMRRIGQSLDEP